MKFEGKINNNRFEDKSILKEIEPGITKDPEGTYELKKEIDGLEYSIELSKRTGLINGILDFPLVSGNWNLGFDADGTHAVTNKGLAVFKKVVDEIARLINKVRMLESVKTINFSGSKVKLNMEEMKELQQILLKKYIESPESFNGFRSEINDMKGNFCGIFEIKDGKVIKKKGNNIIIIGNNFDNETPLETFLNDKDEVMSLFGDEEIGQKLINHLGITYKVNQKRDSNKASSLRMDLYERTLKQKFPEYKFNREKNNIKIYLP